MDATIAQARDIMNRVKDLQSASAVLGWDQETYMPKDGIEARAEQIATLDTLSHEALTNDKARQTVEEIRQWMDQIEEGERAILKVFLRDHDLAVRLPESLVRDTSRAQSLAQEAWKRARAESNFSLFAPHLQCLVTLKSEAAELYGYEENKYDALINLFEPGMKASTLTPVFQRLKEGTITLMNKALPLHESVQSDSITKSYDRSRQFEFGRKIIQQLGFDFDRGRIDLSAHPFCTTFASDDVRLTTRILENDIRSCLFGLIHEAGHGMYEQGVDKKYFRTAAAEGTSMGIHESQSLFWENVIARSEEFWEWALPQLKAVFPEQLEGVSVREFYRAINTVRQSLIRIDSDEATYNLHIIIRFEIENDLINDRIRIEDIPELWNTKMQEYVGITPPNDAQGCLQDVHWSFGGFGYFPSYTLGKLYAAMIWTQLQKEMPKVKDLIRQGSFSPIREWLRENIHRYGKTQTSEEIMLRLTGRTLTETDFLEYIGNKVNDVYGLS